MYKAVTKDVLVLSHATHSTADVSGVVYDSGNLNVGELVELGISFVPDAYPDSSFPSLGIFVVDGNGNLIEVASTGTDGSHLYNSLGSGFPNGAAFGDRVRLMVTAEYNYTTSAYRTDTVFSLSIKGK